MNQTERLDYLVEWFKQESEEYRSLETPSSAQEKERMLRGLMNVRMPAPLPDDVLAIQDAYLQERARERGIVQAADIPTIADWGSMHAQAERIAIWRGDITCLAIDAIVNAANSQMLGCFIPLHACIDNCIHSYAGVQLRNDCHQRMCELRKAQGVGYEQPTAIPLLTSGYNLPAKHVVHIVGPIASGRITDELARELGECYTNTLDLCLMHDIRTIAFCCISTGVFGFPKQEAARIAAETVTQWLDEHPNAIDLIVFNVFKEEDERYYDQVLL